MVFNFVSFMAGKKTYRTVAKGECYLAAYNNR
jgi:hypothetical protein